MAWTKPLFTRVEVDKAGAALQRWNETEPDVTSDDTWNIWVDEYGKSRAALEIINNWRSSHSYPLNTFQTNLRRAARAVDPNPLVAQRIKRLSSVSHKLERFKKMRLSQMQDIGGCRAVVRSVAAVREIEKYYLTRSRIKHKLKTHDDYIMRPQKSGYRGIHLIYRYYSDNSATEVYNDLQNRNAITIPISTRMGHHGRNSWYVRKASA
ncbi:MAG: RelA/SpoT domain-containing protein [Stellaceae bacterium]